MAPWRYDPYLWVHLAGVATVPLWIDLALLGLAVGNPTWPGLELGLILGLGVLPVLVMQLRRPFYIFSLLPGLALRPTALNDHQRRLLSQFQRWRVRLGALLVPIPLVWVLVKLYPLAFLARDITPFDAWGRVAGVAIAALSFFCANLFLQVPVAVLQVLATPDRRMAAVLPYPIESIAADFSWLGLPVNKLLPNLTPQNLTPQVPIAVGNAPTPLEPLASDLSVDLPGAIAAETSNADMARLPEGQAEVRENNPDHEQVRHGEAASTAIPLEQAQSLETDLSLAPEAEYSPQDNAAETVAVDHGGTDNSSDNLLRLSHPEVEADRPAFSHPEVDALEDDLCPAEPAPLAETLPITLEAYPHTS
jgi:hypothetical protein